MLDKFDSGFNHASSKIIGGILNSIIISSFASTEIFPSYTIWLIHILGIVGMGVFIQKMSYWATSYIFGWLLGVIILASSGLLAITDILIYLIPLVFLIYRLRIYFLGTN